LLPPAGYGPLGVIRKTSISGFFALWLYRLGSFLSQNLPLRVSYGLADVLADVHFLARPRPRRALLSNLEVVCGEQVTLDERRRLARTIFRNFGRAIVDFLKLPSLSARVLSQKVSAEGLERLEGAFRSGVGTILLTGHIGGWEVGGAYLSTLGYPISAVAKNHPAAAVTDFFRRRRWAWRVRVLETWEEIATLAELLKQGECVAILGDWDAAGRGTEAVFFGRRTRVPFAYVKLAAETGGRILPGVVLKNPAGGYRVRLDEAIEPRPDDVRGALERCLGILERYIRENLTQWFAFNPIWPDRIPDAGGRS